MEQVYCVNARIWLRNLILATVNICLVVYVGKQHIFSNTFIFLKTVLTVTDTNLGNASNDNEMCYVCFSCHHQPKFFFRSLEYNFIIPNQVPAFNEYHKTCILCSANWPTNGYLECLTEIPKRDGFAVKPTVVVAIQISWSCYPTCYTLIDTAECRVKVWYIHFFLISGRLISLIISCCAIVFWELRFSKFVGKHPAELFSSSV